MNSAVRANLRCRAAETGAIAQNRRPAAGTPADSSARDPTACHGTCTVTNLSPVASVTATGRPAGIRNIPPRAWLSSSCPLVMTPEPRTHTTAIGGFVGSISAVYEKPPYRDRDAFSPLTVAE